MDSKKWQQWKCICKQNKFFKVWS